MPQVSAPSLVEHINNERDRLFKAMSIIACCRLACASKLDGNPEVMTDALQAAHDLVEQTAGALEIVEAAAAGASAPRSSSIWRRMMNVPASEFFAEAHAQS